MSDKKIIGNFSLTSGIKTRLKKFVKKYNIDKEDNNLSMSAFVEAAITEKLDKELNQA